MTLIFVFDLATPLLQYRISTYIYHVRLIFMV